MGVTLGGADRGVAQKFLNETDVGAAFKEVGGECVAETVDRDLFAGFGAAYSLVKNVLG